MRLRNRSRQTPETMFSKKCHILSYPPMIQSLNDASKSFPCFFFGSPWKKTRLTGVVSQTAILSSARFSLLKLARAQPCGGASPVTLPHERPRARRPVCERLQAHTDHDSRDKDIHKARERIWSWRRRWRRQRRKGR